MRLRYPWARRRRRRVRFRGVQFELLEQEETGGHRAQTYSYPYVDLPYTEDFGRLPKEFRVQAIVTGDNYDRDLLRLKRALEKRGRGRLELWHGDPIAVVCRRWRIVERSDAKGFARIAIDFVEAGRRVRPESRGAKSLVQRAIDAVKGAAKSAFTAVASNVSFVGPAAEKMVDLGSSLKDELTNTMDTVDQNAGLASDAASSIESFADRLTSLATDADGFSTEISDILDEIVDLPGDTLRTFTAVGGLLSWGGGLDPVDSSTAVGQIEADNQDSLVAFLEQIVAGQLAEISTRIPFESAQDAAEHRALLADLMDGVLTNAADRGNEEVYRELRAAKALAVRDLDERAARLPARTELELTADTPSIVLAWRLYGDPARGPSLAERNGVRHPAFMPAGAPTEVLAETETDGALA